MRRLLLPSHTYARRPYVVAKGATTTLTNTAATDIINGTEDLDNFGGYDTATGVYTVPLAGIAKVYAAGKLDVTASDWAAGEVFRLSILKGATEMRYGEWKANAAHGEDPSISVRAMFPVVQGDTIKVQGFQNSGNDYALTSSNANLHNYIEIEIDPYI